MAVDIKTPNINSVSSGTNNIYINSEQLVAIAKSIESKKEQIMNVYKSEVLPALELSETCLSVAGLNYSEIISTFNRVYTTMDQQISSMTDALITKIAPNYDAMSMSIREVFNNEFASEMETLISLMNTPATYYKLY